MRPVQAPTLRTPTPAGLTPKKPTRRLARSLGATSCFGFLAACTANSETPGTTPTSKEPTLEAGQEFSLPNCLKATEEAKKLARLIGVPPDIAEKQYKGGVALCNFLATPTACAGELECRKIAEVTVRAKIETEGAGFDIDAYLKLELSKCEKQCSFDFEACADAIQPREDLTGREKEVAYQEEIAKKCTMQGAPECTATLVARANVDYNAAALQLASGTFTPAQYLSLSRDRSRKLAAAERDAIRTTQYCTWTDSDGDWVPDVQDDCPGTSDLTATDDRGCTTPLPQAPSAADVKQVLSSMGLFINPACQGASVPLQTPAGGFYWPENKALGTFILAGRVTNQPEKCPVWYQFQIEELTGATPGRTYMVAFMDRDENKDLVNLGRPVPSGFIQFNPKPTDEGTRGVLGNTGGVARIRYRVRAMNGNGSRGVWGEWKTTHRPSCWALGFDCREE